MNLFVISILLFSFCSFLFGLMIFLKRKDAQGHVWFLFSLFCCIWGLGYAYQINNDVSYHLALIMTRIGDAAAIFIPVTWLHFIYLFLKLRIHKKILLFIYGISTALLLTSPFPIFIKGLKDKSHIGVVHFADGGRAFHIFGILFTAIVSFGFIVMLMEYLKTDASQEKKRGIKLVLVASILGFGGGSLAFFPVYDIDLPVLYGSLIAPFFPILMTVAFCKHQILDVEEIAQAAQRNKLETLGILAASINHELKNPVYIIRTLAEAYSLRVKDGSLGSNQEVIAKSLETSQKTIYQADRAMDVMHRLAGFMKQEPAAVQLVNLRKILEDVYLFLSYEIHTSNIDLAWDLPEDFPSLQAEPRSIEQIFFNLIVNACQAIKKVKIERGVIKVSGKKIPNGVEITIEDNGPGIPSDILPKIFEPFYTTKDTGSGLGLYITKQLVEKCGGTIRVDSVFGKGTGFVLKFS